MLKTLVGADFSFENKMGDTIAFLDTKNLKIKYALSKEEYRKSRADEDIKNYFLKNWVSAFVPSLE